MTGRLFAVTLAEQIACVKREIGLRERVYPRWVATGRLTQRKADDEIAAMKAVLETLEAADRARDPYAEDRRRLAAGLPCGKCNEHHAPGRCPACE